MCDIDFPHAYSPQISLGILASSNQAVTLSIMYDQKDVQVAVKCTSSLMLLTTIMVEFEFNNKLLHTQVILSE